MRGDVTLVLPPANVLSIAGIGFVAGFALWKAKIGPLVHKRQPSRAEPAPSP